MLAFTTDVAGAPANSGLAAAAPSFLRHFLSNQRRVPAPMAIVDVATDVPSRTVPNLASGTAFMAWRS